VSKFELSNIDFEKTVNDEIACKPTWSEKMTVLSTYLESSLNFLFNKLKRTIQFSTVKKKSVSKIELPKTQLERAVRDKISCKTHLE